MQKHYTERDTDIRPTSAVLLVTGIVSYAFSWWLGHPLFVIMGWVALSMGLIVQWSAERQNDPQPRKSIEMAEAIVGCILLSILGVPIIGTVLDAIILDGEQWRDLIISSLIVGGVCIAIFTGIRIVNGLPITTWGIKKADKEAARAWHKQQGRSQ